MEKLFEADVTFKKTMVVFLVSPHRADYTLYIWTSIAFWILLEIRTIKNKKKTRSKLTTKSFRTCCIVVIFLRKLLFFLKKKKQVFCPTQLFCKKILNLTQKIKKSRSQYPAPFVFQGIKSKTDLWKEKKNNLINFRFYIQP